MGVNWQHNYAQRLEWMTTSAIRDILKFAQAPDTISMAGGWPEAALFPVEQLREVCDYVLSHMPQQSLQYGLTDGLPVLRETLAQFMTDIGVPAKTENIVITSGSQQSLDLMGRIFLDAGDTVVVENPTFLGALQAFKTYGVRFLPAPMDDDGVDVERLAALIATEHPKFMYLLPTFQNPTGVTLSLERRQAVIDLAERAGVPILEDDPYSTLRFEGEALPSLASLEAARRGARAGDGQGYRGNVIYLGSFSKMLAPGLRVSWVLCPAEVAGQFVMAKQSADLQSNALSQTIAYEFMRRGWLPAQIQRIRDTYLERRNAMVEAIAEYFPPGIHSTRPQGGLFLWVILPPHVDTVPLLQEAVKRQVAFVPGAPFFVDGSGHNTLRLSFASVPPETIREGIRRLASVLIENFG